MISYCARYFLSWIINRAFFLFPLNMSLLTVAKSRSRLLSLLRRVIVNLPWLVLVLSLVSTLAAWYMARAAVHEAAKIGFAADMTEVISEIEQRMRAYEQVLRSGAAIFAANAIVDRETWLAYVKDLRIEATYPGIQAVGYAQSIDGRGKDAFLQTIRGRDDARYQIWPDGDRAAYVPIVRIAPFEGANVKELGYDLYTEPIRRVALDRAGDSGDATLSGKVTLVQEQASITKQAGTLLFIPVYRRGMPQRTPKERRLALQGYVYGGFRMFDLMRNTLDNHNFENIDVEIFDGAQAQPEALLFDGDAVLHSFAKDFPTPFSAVRHIIVAGRPWTLNFSAHADFPTAFDTGSPRFAIIGGSLMSLMLFGAAWMLSRAWRLADTRAQSMTSAYQESEARLERIIHSAMDAIITIDRDQNIIIFNPAAEKMFRCDAADAIGQTLERFIPERFRSAHHHHIERFDATGVTSRAMGRQLNLFGMRANGDEFPIDASISQLDHEGTKLFTVVLRDITARKAAEDALRASNLKLRELSTYVESAREAERIRIAREIHDDIAGTLTAVKMDLVAMQGLAKTDVQALEERLPHSIRLTDVAVSTTRRIINDLRPSILDNLGVWAAIEWQAGETAQRAGIAHHVEITDDLLSEELPAPRTTALFRIVQEALSNVWRHAQATYVNVLAYRELGDVIVTIEDDGIGARDIDLSKTGHWGIIGMYERARSQGGQVSVTGKRGHGTLVVIRMPLE